MSDSKKKYCYHCGDTCSEGEIVFEEKNFCCNGCKSVYEILNTNIMHQYYSFEKTPGIKPSKSNATRYKFLENEEIADSIITFKEGNTRKVTLFLPDIHCVSCVWLLENLHLLNGGIVASEVNFVKKQAVIIFNSSEISLSELANLLNKIGYPPKFDGNNKNQSSKVSKKFYMQLGVAIFCFGNIMLFSFPEYMNIDESYLEFRSFFSYLIFVISIPLLLFSASDYWKSAFKAVRSGVVNLDVPITLGILALYGRSCFDIFTGNGPGYMDSFAGFILFLLIGKWFQNKTYQALSFERDYKSYFPLHITKINGASETILPIDKLEVDDIIVVKNEEIIPADSILLKGKASIDYSFVTGESKTVSKSIGDEIFAGGKQVGGVIELKIRKQIEQSYLTQLWNQKAFKKNTEISLGERTESLSKYFIYAVIFIAIITGIVWSFIDAGNIVNIITAILIVACPCALALSVPFTFGSAMRTAGRNKFYLKNTETVERLGRVTDIVFDKTGTITTTESSNVEFIGEKLSQDQILAICSLSRVSSHPLSKVIYNKLYDFSSKLTQVENYSEKIGYGIKGTINHKKVKIGSSSWVNTELGKRQETRVYISEENKVVGYFKISNKYRKEFIAIIKNLRDGYNVHLLSGDNDSERKILKEYFPVDKQILFNQKPIDKLNYIQKLQEKGSIVMMLGDGLNDAGALKQSDVGVVVSDDVYNFSPACDGIIDASALNRIPDFLQLGKSSIKILKASYIFSIIYNIIGLSFAVSGFLTPLVAAVLMPLSSISVVALASFSVRYIECKKVQ